LYSFCIVDRLKQAKLYDLKEKEEIKPPAFLRGFGMKGMEDVYPQLKNFQILKAFAA